MLQPQAIASQGPDFSPLIMGYWRLMEWGMSPQQLLAFIEQHIELGVTTADHADIYGGYACEQAPTLTSANSGSNQAPAIMQNMAVRRLTPVECERLQGFPDGFTQAPHRNKPAADGPRYKALGTSMAVNVMAYIGERIQLVEDMQ